MKPSVAFLSIALLFLSPTTEADTAAATSNKPHIVACEMFSLLYKITAEFRDKKIPAKQALLEVKKLTKKSPDVAVEIITDVYGQYKMKSPDWLEGFFLGGCLAEAAREEADPFFQKDIVPSKKTNPKILM